MGANESGCSLREPSRSGAGVPPAAGASRPGIRRGRDARADSRDGCPTTDRSQCANNGVGAFHEPTQPRPLPGGEQAFLRALSVPLLGGVRGGFMVPMRDGMAVAAFHETGSADIPAGVLPVGVSPARILALPKSASRFMGRMRGANVLGFSTPVLTIVTVLLAGCADPGPRALL
ncbi:MAG: hypothetical protein E6L09_05515, partial [Verrucomicrobia bacterium]